MNRDRLRELLASVAAGETDVDAALGRFEGWPYEDVGFARVDHHRHLRLGTPEVIYGEGKSPEQLVQIAGRIVEREANVLITRAGRSVYEAVRHAYPDSVFHEAARCITISRHPVEATGCVAVVTAGTTDIPVAEEAAVTAETCGSRVERVFDVGVAGLHRLLGARDRFAEANAIVVAAGMEGALPSVVGELVSVPVVAVPTSVGYGASFGGLAALLGMINSCSSNVTVVNIDNGFGAGFVAALINRRVVEAEEAARRP